MDMGTEHKPGARGEEKGRVSTSQRRKVRVKLRGKQNRTSRLKKKKILVHRKHTHINKGVKKIK